MQDTECDRVLKIDTQLAFYCDKDLFRAGQTVDSVSGKLTVYEDLPFWKFWAEPTAYQYDIAINVIPATLGTAHPSAFTRILDVERESRSAPFYHRNAFCSGVRRPLFQFNTRQGWKIDPTAIQAGCGSFA